MPRQADFHVPAIQLDRTSPIALHRQIYTQIASAIRNGSAPGRARLPSSRVLAKLLKTSRNTVLAAFEDLASEGLIENEPRTGVRVSRRVSAPALTLFGLRATVRAAHFPARTQPFQDPDGNALYFNVRLGVRMPDPCA